MIFYAKLYYFYSSFLSTLLRVGLAFILLALLISTYGNGNNIALLSSILCLFLIWEIFFTFSIARKKPYQTISKNMTKEYLLSATLPVRYSFLAFEKTEQVLRVLPQLKQVQFLLNKADISVKELPKVILEKDKTLAMAFDLAKKNNGLFITSMDIMTSFLLLAEKESKLLFNKGLQEKDLLNILSLTRANFPFEELPVKKQLHFRGDGIGEILMSGWTLETKKYTEIFTYKALAKKPILLGREKEFQKIVEGLTKRENNNVLLIGERGIGKENLLACFAYESYQGTLPKELNHKKVLQVLLGPLIAGTETRGALESRLQAVIEEVSHAGNVILYIPEFQNILGDSSYNVDLSGALYPYLQNGKFPIITSMTNGNYKAYVEKNPLKEVFDIVKLDEPEKTTALFMLEEKSEEIENTYAVSITYKAIQKAIELANKYIQDSLLPGSAAILLDDVARQQGTHHKKDRVIREEHVIQQVEEKTHTAIGKPKKEEKEQLLQLEEILHRRVIGQDVAISAVAEALRRRRTGFTTDDKPISFLFLGPTGVGKTELAKTLAQTYFGGEDHMLRFDMSEYATQSGMKRLLGAMPGEGTERGELTDKIHDNPYALVLLDEFEKANSEILNLFLQVLDDGRLTDNKGKTVSLKNCIIIATSNAGSEFIRQTVKSEMTLSKDFQKKLLNELQTKGIFKPELLNRFDAVITFKPLTEKEIKEVVVLLLEDVIKKLTDQDIAAEYDEKLLAKIVTEGYDPEFGARPLRRYIQDSIEDVLSKGTLQDTIKRGDSVRLTVDEKNEIQIQTINSK